MNVAYSVPYSVPAPHQSVSSSLPVETHSMHYPAYATDQALSHSTAMYLAAQSASASAFLMQQPQDLQQQQTFQLLSLPSQNLMPTHHSPTAYLSPIPATHSLIPAPLIRSVYPSASSSASIFSAPLPASAMRVVPIQQRRPLTDRPVHKLTVKLMETYSGINDRYYLAKRQKKLQEQQAAAAAAAAAGSSASSAAASVAHTTPPQLSHSVIPQRLGETNDGYSDREYNYIVTENELLKDRRYQVAHSIGKGSFGRVVKAWDHLESKYVAIKIVRAKSAFLKQSQIEMKLLNSVAKGAYWRKKEEKGESSDAMSTSSPASSPSPAASPSPTVASVSSTSAAAGTVGSTATPVQREGDKWNIVCMLDQFMHHGHQCIVFELLSANLYELLRNTRFSGISLKLISKFTFQILMALAYLSTSERGDERIIHCDVKPENICLVSPSSSRVKLLDLGSACFINQKVYTYIQSRFYRAPEVILGLSYNAAIDMWSLGCILFELLVGTPLFDGADEHDQLIRHVDLLGMPPAYIIERTKKAHKFFTRNSTGQGLSSPTNGGWYLADPTLVPGATAAAIAVYAKLYANNRYRNVAPLTPLERLKRRLGHKYQDTPVCNAFCDLIMQTLTWDAKSRIKPVPALGHEFMLFFKPAPQTPAASTTAAPQTPIAKPTPASEPHSATVAAGAIDPAAAAVVHQVGMNGTDDTKSNGIATVAATTNHDMVDAKCAHVSAILASTASTSSASCSSGSTQSATATHAPAVAPVSSDAMVTDTTSTGASHVCDAANNAAMVDSLQHQQPTANGVAPMEDVAPADDRKQLAPAPSSAAASSTASATASKSAALPPPHQTPTRKRHSQSSPRACSPTSAQSTPKTRAVAAPTGRNLFDTKNSPLTRSSAAALLQMQQSPSVAATHQDPEMEQMQLPAVVYQSPSIKPFNRSLASYRTQRKSSGSSSHTSAAPVPPLILSAAAGSNGSAPSSNSSTPQRKGSEKSEEATSSTEQPHQGVWTRGALKALSTPPSGPVTPNSAHPTVSALDRQLASDPLALHLDVSKQAPAASSSSPPLAAAIPAVFASPYTLRKRSGVTTRSQLQQKSLIDEADMSHDEEEPRTPGTTLSRRKSSSSHHKAAIAQACASSNMDVDVDGTKENQAVVNNTRKNSFSATDATKHTPTRNTRGSSHALRSNH